MIKLNLANDQLFKVCKIIPSKMIEHESGLLYDLTVLKDDQLYYLLAFFVNSTDQNLGYVSIVKLKKDGAVLQPSFDSEAWVPSNLDANPISPKEGSVIIFPFLPFVEGDFSVGVYPISIAGAKYGEWSSTKGILINLHVNSKDISNLQPRTNLSSWLSSFEIDFNGIKDGWIPNYVHVKNLFTSILINKNVNGRDFRHLIQIARNSWKSPEELGYKVLDNSKITVNDHKVNLYTSKDGDIIFLPFYCERTERDFLNKFLIKQEGVSSIIPTQKEIDQYIKSLEGFICHKKSDEGIKYTLNNVSATINEIRPGKVNLNAKSLIVGLNNASPPGTMKLTTSRLIWESTWVLTQTRKMFGVKYSQKTKGTGRVYLSMALKEIINIKESRFGVIVDFNPHGSVTSLIKPGKIIRFFLFFSSSDKKLKKSVFQKITEAHETAQPAHNAGIIYNE